MQGLGALEFVLFGTGSEELAPPGDAYRCAYGRAIAANIATIADEIDAAWSKPDGIAAQWSNPGPDNPLYRSDDEAMTELFNVFVHGLEMIRDVRINGFLGETPDKDRPRQAIFWRSGATAVSLQANLDGLRDLFEVSGIAGGLPSDTAWIADSLAFEFRTADTMLDGLDVGDALADAEARSRLVSVRLITSHLSELFGVNLSAALGLSAGFSSLDGD
jgi:predicted lipoprotein